MLLLFVSNKARGRISKWVFQESKTSNFPKNEPFLSPDTHMYVLSPFPLLPTKSNLIVFLMYHKQQLANIYLIKLNNRTIRKKCEVCSKLTIQTPEQSRSGVIIVNLEHISHLFLVFLLLILNK